MGLGTMTEFFNTIARDEKGATAVEYGLILALVFLAMLGAVQAFGQNTIVMWTDTSDTISNATAPKTP